MHGSKKWIRDYRGRLKRSNNRTKLDFYAGLKAWNGDNIGRYYRKEKTTVCPQCKHVRKQMENNLVEHWKARQAVKVEWEAKYGDKYWVMVDGKTLYFMDYFHRHPLYVSYWTYDDRNYFCYKHERMYEQKWEMWSANVNGKKENYNWSVKHERQKYRRKVKNLMQRAKYDEAFYEDIVPPRRGWLD